MNRANYIQYINSAFDTSFSGSEPIAQIVQNLVTKLSLTSDYLAEIAKRSYKHVNGFTKIVLYDSKNDGIKVRLHIWNEYYKHRVTDLHDHRWSYYSIPILGSFVESRYSERSTDEKNGISKVRYKCFSRGESEWLNLEGYEKVSLIKDSENIRSANEIYFCEAGVVHQLQPLELPSATLIVTFDPTRDYARVYRDKIESEDFMTIHVPNLRSDDVMNEFSYVTSLL